jgi:hypothetical protein
LNLGPFFSGEKSHLHQQIKWMKWIVKNCQGLLYPN